MKLRLEFILAVLGVFGTLSGTALGSFVTWKIQQQEIVNENATRFHEQRLRAYTELMVRSDYVILNERQGNRLGLGEAASYMEAYSSAHSEAMLLAGRSVVDDVAELHHAVETIVSGGWSEEAQEAFIQASVNFRAAVREELGVASN